MRTAQGLLSVLLLAGAQRLAAQDTRLAGFASAEVQATDRRTDRWAFGLEPLDLYLSSKLSNHISFLTEVVFEYTGGGFITDVERMMVTFAPRSYLRVSIGKFHTPIGYWNTAYHSGTLIQPTNDRPLLFQFDDEGGILPLKTIGLQIAGRDISPLHLGYDISVGNGIGSTPIADNSNTKAWTMALHSQVTSALRVGASLYVDRIAAGTPSLAGPTLAEPVRERVIGGYAVYQAPRWELAAEWQRVTHSAASGADAITDGFYVYAGYRVGRVTGYGRYEELRFPPADLYYEVNDATLAIVGARYDFAATVTTKFELRRRRTALTGVANEVALQVAVGF